MKQEDAKIGAWVDYIHELGRIKSWNDRYIFVVFHCPDWDNYQHYTAEVVLPSFLKEV